MTESAKTNGGGAQSFDVIIVGAGFGGIYALHKMRQLGLAARVLEQGDDIGGTWYWNRYPGARCDVESMQYSYSFSDEIAQEWEWKELYATQPEIQAYIKFVADKLKLHDGIQLNTRVTAARFDENNKRWTVTTDKGETYEARFCIMATGCLSVPLVPQIPGVSDFGGEVYMTSSWPKEGVEVSGKRVGLVGTGSSGIQITPRLAEKAAELHVFQRTPNYSIPAQNRPLDRNYVDIWKKNYPERRKVARMARNNTMNSPGQRSGTEVTPAQFKAELESRWASGGIGFMYAFTDITTNRKVNEMTSEFVRSKIREIVRDPKKAAILAPANYPIGAKRICVDTDYFETFNRDNVFLHDIKADPIKMVDKDGIVLEGGEKVGIDILVLATGFDAMTGALNRIDIRGLGGKAMRDKWEHGPLTYLGLMVAGFPNMFIVAGPQSPSVFTNMVTSIEQHVDWIGDTLKKMDAEGKKTIDADEKAEEAWVRHVAEVADRTLIIEGVNSWYTGANIPGKPRVITPYLGGAVVYMDKLNEATKKGFEGFKLS
ncbi:MAG: flavin-containing monooxygenase [Flavobacteriaceae bacterium]